MRERDRKRERERDIQKKRRERGSGDNKELYAWVCAVCPHIKGRDKVI